jgi:hypothetical protein
MWRDEWWDYEEEDKAIPEIIQEVENNNLMRVREYLESERNENEGNDLVNSHCKVSEP